MQYIKLVIILDEEGERIVHEEMIESDTKPVDSENVFETYTQKIQYVDAKHIHVHSKHINDYLSETEPF